MIYNKPSARIKYSGLLSTAFPIAGGTKQGCPLSPLQFNLAIKLLAVLIRNSPDVKALEVVGNSYKINLYADGALLIVLNLISLPNLMAIFETFG